jgi:hypothetical protein
LIAPFIDALSGVAVVPEAAAGLTAPVTDALSGVAPLPGSTPGLIAPVTDALSGVAPLPGSSSGLIAPVTDALNGAAVVPDAAVGLTASVTDGLSGVAPLPGSTSGLIAPITDALTGAAPLPGAATGATGPVTDALTSVASLLPDPALATVAQGPSPTVGAETVVPGFHLGGGASPLPSIATVGDAIAPASEVLSSVPPAAAPIGLPAEALASPPEPGLFSATPPGGGGSPLPFDDAFPINPATIAHVLASPETRLVIVGLFGAYATGRASGVGMLDFTQPFLRSCTAGVRLAFSPVRLVPCGRGASSPGKTLVSRATALVAEVKPSHRGVQADSRGWFSPPDVAAGTPPAPIWFVPRSNNVVLRAVAAVLAALSAAIAGVGGLRVVRRRAGAPSGYPRNP